MRAFIIALLLILFIGSAGAVTLDNTPTFNFGPAPGFMNPGTIQASDIYATDDLKVDDDAAVLGDLSVSGAISSGSGSIVGGVYSEDFTIASAYKFTTGTGITKNKGVLSAYLATYLNDTTLAANKDLSLAGTGKFTTGTGVTKVLGVESVYGDTHLNGTDIASGATLAVTSADKLTVGGVIVPQYWDFNVPITATTVDANIFIPTSNWQVIAVSEVHSVAGNDAGAVNAIVRKTNSTGAPSAGVAVTAGSFDLKGTANTIQSGTVRSGADLWTAKVNSTERLTLDVTGTLATLAGGVVTVRLKRIA
jgi:hypothetical protein